MASLQSISNWDDEADVIIVGSGLAGSSAAIESRDADPDADILLLEKMHKDLAGGNSRASGQCLLIPKDATALFTYQRNMNAANPVPDEVLKAWAERMVALEPWIKARAEEAGQTYSVESLWSDEGEDVVYEYPEFGAAAAIRYGSTILPTPNGVWLAINGCACAAKRKIRMQFESPVVDLVQNPDSLEVFGVITERNGKRQAIKARRGVILACGGYENNLDMQRNYYGFTEVYPLGTPGNTGDGIKMLQKAGADLWHMRNRSQTGGIWPGFKVPDFDGGFIRNNLFTAFSWLEVGGEDSRFYNETAPHHQRHYKYKPYGLWVDVPIHFAQPVHMIFDESTRENMCLGTNFMSWNTAVLGYQWSDDNQAEVDKGWIVQAASIEALAQRIGRDPKRLRQTVDRYNDLAANGHDADYGRAAATLVPLQGPPFYAIAIVPTIVCTGGGAKRTKEMEVISTGGNPIPRLYEAGELGSMYSDLYQDGSYLMEAMISGRVAGENAVGLSPWDK